MELKRNIYNDLLRWKQRDSGKVLELKGARQTGKTFILDKFAKEYYKIYIYINMAQLSGEQFLACIEQASAWKPGEPRIEKALHEAFRLFDSRFEDNKDTIIVIDEIQESAKVYSRIREFSREFLCHFIVAGSYLGKTLEKGYFLSAGDTENLMLNTLSFEEFIAAFGKRELYNGVDLLGSSNPLQYDELKEYYKIYCEIGGYPDVINCYMETQDMQECKKVLTQIIGTFIEESTRVLGGIQEMILLEQIFPAIAQLSVREKKEYGNLITELSRIIYNGKSNRTTRRSISAVIDWLCCSDIIGYCGKANECDPVQRDAAQAIIEHNIYGLDIDERAYQLAYFALMMKARQYDRRFLTREIAPQVYCPKGYTEGLEFGSLLNVESLEPKPKEPEELTIFNLEWEKDINNWNFRRLLNQKYDVVITNPPYMGSSGMNAKLSDYVKKNYPDSKSDLFAVFIERCLQMAKKDSYTAMITQHAFMFLSSYEKLRGKLLHTDFINMAHLGARAFEEIGGEVVQTTSFVMRKSNIKDYKATFARLVDYNNQQEKEKEKAFLAKNNLHTAEQESFSKIPGSPIAYWVSEKMLRSFENNLLNDVAYPKQGFATGNNDNFLRLWYETEFNNIILDCSSIDESKYADQKWYPCNKGGSFRRWYGNYNFIANWKNDGYEMKDFKGSVIRNPQFYYKEGMTWSTISSGKLSMRYSPKGFVFETKGSVCFPQNYNNLNYLLGLLNSHIVEKLLLVLSPTLDYHEGPLGKVPVIINSHLKPDIENIVEQNISLSKTDWDSFETSWDFKAHPFIKFRQSNALWGDPTTKDFRNNGSIQLSYKAWETFTEIQFSKLKANEEELNRIFIDIYGLQDELTPEVEDKDVTVRKADLIRDIKSFVSYAVGCMFGRYSLDVDGLAYAGGDWDDSKYSTFIPDADNCIPVTDEEYFEDDIVGLFVAFVKKVYGVETLEENLEFIAKALGNKGNTPREIIRNYFVKDFYKDHVKIYQKRPIYWLYDSGKQDGFKALVYMHRYDANTTGLVRVDYLHKTQKIYMSEIDRMQDEIENGKTSADIAKAEKRKEKLIKQLKETKEYDEKIAHLALSRIAIDLDDGVKVNYEKVQTAQDGKKLDILGKI
ncbi:BREX-1 system adenine-specific DNA-methyltransferase PglX [Lacrimispora sp.]|uniref:BREX-1 system adenine-specific DNA-methyltransferase PglX n=1 Tax=Lacrimispora sp. TaxID=2719234 RepID=UPI0028964149|nr:BREX-1 system adenine-specific DNA-methyltransferase PglX [Lacrimispora sp.]